MRRIDDGLQRMGHASDNPEKAEYLVRGKQLKTVHVDQAIEEKGNFGNQSNVAGPRTPKWDDTAERLKKVFGVE